VISVPENQVGALRHQDHRSAAKRPGARQKAREAGAAEAWFVDELGLVTEGAASNAWIIDEDGALRTRDIQANILRGVTRLTLLDVARREGLTVERAPIHDRRGQEGARSLHHGRRDLVLPVIAVDGAAWSATARLGPWRNACADSISTRRAGTPVEPV
jgi:D-alanine transaminase